MRAGIVQLGARHAPERTRREPRSDDLENVVHALRLAHQVESHADSCKCACMREMDPSIPMRSARAVKPTHDAGL